MSIAGLAGLAERVKAIEADIAKYRKQRATLDGQRIRIRREAGELCDELGLEPDGRTHTGAGLLHELALLRAAAYGKGTPEASTKERSLVRRIELLGGQLEALQAESRPLQAALESVDRTIDRLNLERQRTAEPLGDDWGPWGVNP